MSQSITNQVPVDLSGGVVRAGQGDIEWSILGHTYWLKAETAECFAFETLDPPGTFVPVHIHPAQDEFIHVIEGQLDLYLDGAHHIAKGGDLVRMPMGIPHGYYNISDKPTRALFWVTPARRLRELFDQLHELEDIPEVLHRSAQCGVDFLPPDQVAFDLSKGELPG